MAYEPRRTLLIGLSALTVIFAAALFPAAGVGSHPGSSSAPGDSVAPDTATPPLAATPTSMQTDDRDETTPKSTDAATPTPETASPTAAPGSGPEEGGSNFLDDLTLMGLLSALAKGVAYLTAAVLVIGLGFAVRGAEPGTPRVHLPFGTITLPFVIPEQFAMLSTGISRLTMGFVVSLSGSVMQLLDASGAALKAVVGGLGIALGEGLRGTAALLATLPLAIGTALSGLLALPTNLLAVSWSLPTVQRSVTGSTDRPDADAREAGPAPVDAESDEDRGPLSVRQTWVVMVDLLPISRSPSTTPREFARRAVDSGFPERPIGRVTRAFEEVVYGGYDTSERGTSARDALASLRDRLGGDT